MDQAPDSAPVAGTRLGPLANAVGPAFVDTPRAAGLIALAALVFLIASRRGFRSVLGG